eukprot:Lithocolla_globosa_v1_NODE_5779_length_1185_cov_11.625664.p1 type:complete len:150 gc:universal NODE_5779_length_1185_cov_11.625664:688-1137(+)
MVVDRSGTTCLLALLGRIYPEYFIIFQIMVALDISSHYIHMYKQLLSGSNSHKKMDQKENFLLRQYYSNEYILFVFCVGNEWFFLFWYIQNFSQGWHLWGDVYIVDLIVQIAFPIMCAKQFMNVLQFKSAAAFVVEQDVIERKRAKSKK